MGGCGQAGVEPKRSDARRFGLLALSPDLPLAASRPHVEAS
jgi:hypothetical protein